MDKRKLDTRLVELMQKNQGEALFYDVTVTTKSRLQGDACFFLPTIQRMNFQHVADNDENYSLWSCTLQSNNILRLTNEDWVKFIQLLS